MVRSFDFIGTLLLLYGRILVLDLHRNGIYAILSEVKKINGVYYNNSVPITIGVLIGYA